MSWKIRHEGSPQSVDGISVVQIVEGLQDGQWEPTDEVMGPEDRSWVAIENHPALAEVAAELEAPPPAGHDEETTLDLNALIDVCLVLLIFFMLTTSYAILQKRFDAPVTATDPNKPNVRVVKHDVQEQMVMVEATMENGKPVVRVEKQVVSLEFLAADLHNRVGKGKNNQLLLKYDDAVPHGVVVEIEDDARLAGLEKVCIVVPPKDLAPKK